MDATLVRLVWRRAKHRCEYCQISQEYVAISFEINHIIARKHRGPTVADNLAQSCFHCNSSKGSNIGGRDPLTRKLTALFNPRRHKWERHFRWDGPYLMGRTPIGRATVDVLKFNDNLRVELRDELIDEGVFP